jgi:predicted nuclease with TOPRIM domain
MNKNYEEIEFCAGDTIVEAVKDLLKYKEKGILAKGSFNGIILYSDTVTIDGAYQEIMGKTKTEFDKEQEDWRNEYEKRDQEFKESIPELTKMWIQKGKEILKEDKWAYWTEIVPYRLKDLYQGIELGNCLDIVKILNNNGTLEEAKETINNQGHSGMSYGLVCAMVKEFCSRGNEFVEYLAKNKKLLNHEF